MSLCLQPFSTETGLFAGLFLAGLSSGFTHCVSMCGPFVISIKSSVPQGCQESTLKGSLSLGRLSKAALLPYHIGRMTTYIALAVIFSTIFNMALFFTPARQHIAAMLLFTAALVFISNIIPALGRMFPFLKNISLPIPYGMLSKFSAPLYAKDTILHRFFLGVLLGFMPCGMVIAALMTVISFDNPWESAAGMASFALGTMPALIITAFAGQILFNKYPKAIPATKSVMATICTLILVLTASKMILT